MIRPHKSSDPPLSHPPDRLAWRSGETRPEWVPRIFVLFFSAAVVVYSLSVIWVVATSGDVGIRCVFGTLIKAPIPSSYSWYDRSLGPGHRLVPEVGDRIVRIARPGPGGWELPIAEGDYSSIIRAQRLISHEPSGSTIEVDWLSPRAGRGAEARGMAVVRQRPFQTYVWSLIWFAQEMVIFGIGALVYWRRPLDLSAKVFYWLCVVTVGAYVGGYHWSEIVISRPLIFLFAPLVMLVPVVSLHFYLVFPRPNPLMLLRRRLILWVVYGVPAVYLLALWGAMAWLTVARERVDRLSPLPGSLDSLQIPGGTVAERLQAQNLVKWLALGYVGYSVVIFGLCIVCLVYSFRRARNRAERSQVQWILLASVISSFLIAYLLWLAALDTATLGLDSAAWPMYVVSLLYTSAYAFSISRYRLTQAEEFFNRGVRYLLVSVVVGVLYSGILVAGALLIGQSLRSDQTSREGLVVAVTALAMLVLSGAARDRFQKAIDRRFFREKYKLDRAMNQMSRAVEQLVDSSALGSRLLEAASEVLGLDWGAFYLRDDRSRTMNLAACLGPQPDHNRIDEANPLLARLSRSRTVRAGGPIGRPDPAADSLIALGGEVAAALEAEGQLAGVLILGPKRNGLPFDDEELAFLGALASVSSLALRSAAIQQTLEELNQQLRDKVEKIAEQQRRIMILQDQLVERAELDPSAPRASSSSSSSVIAAPSEAFERIRGSSPAMRKVLDLVRKSAASPSSVLILGESGTGKELLAEAIHQASPRAQGPFVRVHCAALSQGLLESELFGHVRGAFTGADRDRVGRFQQADGGTLFLDEIGDINLEVQTKLLRVLQTHSFEKVGSSHPIKVDVRIVAATNQDLPALIRAGRFREDLYYRLNVIGIRTPPLRERKDDIFELAVHILGQHARRLGKPVTHLAEDAIEALVAYSWPGNVRELENVIERSIVLADGPAITRAELPPEILNAPSASRSRSRRPAFSATAGPTRQPVADPLASPAGPPNYDSELSAYERHRLLDALSEARGNKSEAARLLGLPRSTFMSKLKKHGLLEPGSAS